MKVQKNLITIVGLVMIITLISCNKQRPVEPVQRIQIKPSETVFVIPLLGNEKDQKKVMSAEALEEKMVMTKEITLPQRWIQTGRFSYEGEWVPTVSLYIVDRTPVTVEYAASDVDKKKDADAIWVESSDSVGFSVGFSVSALIKEEDASTFLYRYQSTSLAHVMNTEVRARIAKGVSSFAAQYPLDILRTKKGEMIKYIENDIVEFFKERGISITTIALIGGMTYENIEIQKSIDNVFITQQEKERAAALLAAQKDVNAKSESAAQQDRLNAITKATGEAEAIRAKAKADADAVLMKAESEAKSIKLVNDAAKEAQSNPLFIELKKIEVENAKMAKWLGTVPTTLIDGNGNSGMNMFIQTPAK